VVKISIWRVFLFFQLVVIPICLHAQERSSRSLRFHHISADENFGLGNVWAVQEDYEGFIWFGTEDGILKYDGYDLTSYRHNKFDPNSLSNNTVICLFEDSNRNLWVGTFGGGLDLYDRQKNIFHHFRHDPDDPASIPYNRIKTIIEDKKGNLWFGTEGGGVATCGPYTGEGSKIKFKIYQHDENNTNSLSSDLIRSLVEDKNENIYVGTFGGGINVIDSTRSMISRLIHDKENINSVNHNKIVELFIDSKDRMWVGTFGGGAYLYLPKENRFVHYLASDDKFTLNHNEAETITEDKLGNIWIGTDNGLSKLLDNQHYEPENRFQTFVHEPLNENSLLSNSIKIVYTDSKNSLWVGSYYGGVNMYNDDLFKFYPIKYKPWEKNSLSNDNVNAFVEDKNGNLWVGTDGGGLNFLENGVNDIYADNYKVKEIKNPFTGEAQEKIKSMKLDHNGNIWIGYWAGGLYKLNIENGRYEYFGLNNPNSDFSAYSILSIAIDKNNNVWTGSFSGGVSRYDQTAKKFKTYNRSNGLAAERFNSILIDSQDRIWLGGEIGGLQLYDKESDSFQTITYKDVLTKDVSITCLLETREGKILIGTVSTNIISYDPEEQTALSYDFQMGYRGNVIHAMIEDDRGKIWIGTNNGLLVYDSQENSIIRFTKYDGLQGNQFNNGSVFRCSNGLMLFGGTQGWNGYYPDSISRDRTKPKIAFTQFWLNGVPYEVSNQKSPLDYPVNSDQTVFLKRDQNSFGVGFAALEFNFTNQNQYAYMLEGFDKTWQYINVDRKAIFTNLFPGEYKLRIKATNRDGFWFEKDMPKTIVIQPAWWQTLIFKVALALLIILVIYIVHRWRVSFFIQQTNKLEDVVKQRTFELNIKNEELNYKNKELASKNNEILSQNEELTAQNDQIIVQREQLEITQDKLKRINENLESMVDKRTKKLNETIKELDKTVLELDRFVYSASHDLSAPLKSIRGLVQIAKIKNNSGSVDECLSYIETSIGRLEDVIKSLVEYSRNTHNDIIPEAFKLSHLVDDVINELAFLPETEKVKIYNNVESDADIYSDKARYKIILNNLISNGLKYADFEKTDPFIKISYQQKGGTNHLSISDNGIGIAPEYMDKIFNMYYRASEKSQGSGLGLFIIREAVLKLGGTIDVKSEERMGTTFTIKVSDYGVDE